MGETKKRMEEEGKRTASNTAKNIVSRKRKRKCAIQERRKKFCHLLANRYLYSYFSESTTGRNTQVRS